MPRILVHSVHSSPDTVTSHLLFWVEDPDGDRLDQLRSRFRALDPASRPSVEGNPGYPSDEWGIFFTWLAQQGVQIENGPRYTSGLDFRDKDNDAGREAFNATVAATAPSIQISCGIGPATTV